MKDIFSVLKPIYEQASEKDRQLLLSQITNPVDTLKELKAFNESLGITTGQNPQLAMDIERLRTERELKIEEIRGQRQQADRQFSLDRQSRMWDREDNKARWEMVKGVLEGPVGKTIQNLGSGVQQRISGQPQGQPQPQIPNPVKITCPNPQCTKEFTASSDWKNPICPWCNTQLRLIGPDEMASPPAQEQPPAAEEP